MALDDNNEITFLRLYKYGITQFNMLERNMAYCQWHADPSSLHQDRLKQIHEYSFSEKLQKVRALLSAKAKLAPYELFLNQAEQCRLFRNKLVHGHWEFRWFLEEPIRFHVPAPFEEGGSMTLENFAEKIRCIEETGALFSKLREAHPL